MINRDPMQPIEVLNISSTGLPARHPLVEAQRAQGLLWKVASKVSVAGDLMALAGDVFSCGWPDVTVSFRQSGASASGIHSWTLRAPQPDHEGQDRGADHAA